MSYGVKYRCTHLADTNGNETRYDIEILKLNYTGAVTELKGWEETFLLEYDRVNVREPFKTPINNARLEFYLAVRGAGDLAVLTEIFTSDEDEYQMRIKQDTTVIWTGWILKDLLQYSDGDYPYRGTIVAKDLTRLSQYTFPLANDRQKLIVTIADLLDDLGFGLDIYTYTNWTNDAFSGSDDFLNLTYHETRAMRDYKENGDEDDQPQSNEFWLDALLRNFGLIIRQANGSWRIYQLSGMTDGTSVQQYRYNSAGVKQSGASVDLSTTIDSNNRFLLPSSQNFVLPAIKQANVLWDHRADGSGIQFPDIKIFTGAGSETYSQFFISDGTPEIQLRFQVSGVFDISVDNEGLYAEYEVYVETTGSDYYLQDDNTWDTTLNTKRVPLRYRGGRSQGSTDYVAIGDVSFTSNPVPNPADGTLRIKIYSAPSADSTTYRSFQFEIKNDTAESNSKSLAYSLTQGGNYSYIYDHGTVYFGDGPVDYADSALRYGLLDSEVTADGWKRVGEVTSDNLFKLLLREFVDLQASGLRLLEAELYGYYQPNQMLVYEATDFFMLGGSLTGNNVWRVDFLGVGYSLPTVTFSELIRSVTNSAFAGNATNFLAERSASFEEKQYITRTTSSLTGTITSIPVEAVSIPVGKVGDPVYIFNIQTGIVDEFILAESYRAGATSLVVQSGAVTGTVPEGSWIVYTGERLSSYITQTDNAITLGVRSADVALLSDDSILTDESGDEYYFVEGDYTSQIIESQALINIRADQILAQVSAIVGEDLSVLNDIVLDIAQLQNDVNNSETAINSLQTTVSALPTASEFATLESKVEINTDSVLLGVREFSYALFSDNDEFITADGDTFAFVDNGDVLGLIRYNESLINIESDRIDLKVREIGSATAIGVLSTVRTAGNTYTQVLLDDNTLSQNISLRSGDNLRLFNNAGQSEQVTVNGDQTLTKGNSSIQTVTINSKNFQYTYAPETSHLSFPGYQMGSEINVLKDEIVLKVDSNGNIASIELDGSADAGSTITISADQINIVGVINAINAEGTTTIDGDKITTGSITATQIDVANLISSGSIVVQTDLDAFAVNKLNVVIPSDTEPATREDSSALQDGDMWIDTNDGNKPYVYDGGTSSFVAAYTSIDGGNITTGTIDAARIDVAGVITAGSLITETVLDTAIEGVNVTIRATTAPTARLDATDLQTGDIWIDTDDGDKPYSWNGTAWVASYTSIDGGNIITGSITADKLSVANLSAIDTDTGSLTVSDTLTIGASGSLSWTGGDISTSGINLDIVSGTAYESAKGLTWGSTKKVYSLTAGSGQAISELVFASESDFTGDAPAIRFEADNVDINASVDISGALTLGTDLALADGGTGASLSDPGADRILFWDDSNTTVAWLQVSTGLTLSGTSLTTASDIPQFTSDTYSGAPGGAVGKPGDIAYDVDLGGVYIKVSSVNWVQVN